MPHGEQSSGHRRLDDRDTRAAVGEEELVLLASSVC